MTRDLPACRRF